MSNIIKAEEQLKNLSDKEIETVKNAINGMSKQEKIVAAEALPVDILLERIKREYFVMKQNLEKIADIIN